MIAYLDGRVAALKENQLILDVNHMGTKGRFGFIPTFWYGRMR